MVMPLASPGAHASDAIDGTLTALAVKCSSREPVGFNGRDSSPAAVPMASFSGELVVRASPGFFNPRGAAMEDDEKISAAAEEPRSPRASTVYLDLEPSKKRSPEAGPRGPEHEVAVKLQKVYKSFRTRRQLADCAVLVDQRWWKLLDFALLKRSSVSFFDIEKPESAISKWSRARTRAAKVGKGLSKDDKAQKLALQHWLEAIDPRHRYGHNLHYYYDCWLRCESKQPFFYWLDVGEGKEVNHKGLCPRSKLHEQCIKYLGPKEREAYEVIVEDSRFMYKQTRRLLDTTEGPKDAKWIFVLSTLKKLYVGQKKKGTFQHSSFLAGGATSAAGRLIIEGGILKAVWPHSGHYRPTEQNFQEFMSFLEENNVDVSNVKKVPLEEGEEGEELSTSLRSSSSRMNLSETTAPAETKENSSCGESISHSTTANAESRGDEGDAKAFRTRLQQCFHAKFSLNVPKKHHKGEFFHKLSSKGSDQEDEPGDNTATIEKECYRFVKRNLFADEKGEEEGAAWVLPELILRRINSKKGMQSYQLGKQPSFRWTTGAGPRIVCVRDYPSELQFRSLEQVNLSPRGAGVSRLSSLPRPATFHNRSISEMAWPKD